MKEDTAKAILNKLEKQEKDEGSLPLLLEFYRELIQLQISTRNRIGKPQLELEREALRQRMQKGVPLLQFDILSFDQALLQSVFIDVLGIFSRYSQLFGEDSEKLKNLETRRLLFKKTLRAWYTGKELSSSILDGVNHNLKYAIIQAALQPFLTSYADSLSNYIEQEIWRKGCCPICGGIPDLAFIKQETGERWLLCSRCDTEWLFQRLECPYCGNQDQNALAFFTEDTERYRLYVCERCKTYLKAVDLRKAESEALLPLERFYTLDLDRQAAIKGYHSGQ